MEKLSLRLYPPGLTEEFCLIEVKDAERILELAKDSKQFTIDYNFSGKLSLRKYIQEIIDILSGGDDDPTS